MTTTECPLLPRQLRVLDFASAGLSTDQVAAVMGITPKTANKYFAEATLTLQSGSRAGAVFVALQNGWIR